jgi:hypothetical protein
MQRKRFIQAVLSIAMACVALLAQQSPISAASVTPNVTLGPYWIVGLPIPQKCINDPNNSTVDGTQMIIYHCVLPSTSNEEWYFQEVDLVGGVTYYWIWSGKSGKCLTVQNASTANNAPIIQYTCNTGGNEEWRVAYVKTVNGLDYYRIIGRQSGKCITVQNKSTADGAKLLLYDCNGGDNQHWTWFSPSQVGLNRLVTS